MRRACRSSAISVLILAIVFGSGVAYPAAKPLKRVEFLTNYVFNGRHAPFFVGVDKGFYRDAGFDVHISPATGSGFVVAALEGGKADYGMADATTVVQAIAKGARVKGFFVYMDVSTSGLASLKPYPTPESLAGRTIAASLTDSVRVVLPIIFHSRGIDPSSVKWEAADPGTYFALLLEGKVDLITASSDGDMPALVKLAAQRRKPVSFSLFADWGYDVLGYLLVAPTDGIAAHPDDVKAFASATARAVRYATDHPTETARLMVRDNPTMNYETTLVQWREAAKAMNTRYVKLHGYGIATPDRLQRTLDLVGQVLKLNATLTPADVYASGLSR